MITGEVNQFVSNATFLYPVKHQRTVKVFWCFQGVEKGYIGNKWVNIGLKLDTLHKKIKFPVKGFFSKREWIYCSSVDLFTCTNEILNRNFFAPQYQQPLTPALSPTSDKCKLFMIIPAGIYLLKINNKNTRKRCEIYSKLTIDTGGVVLMSLLLTLNIFDTLF